MYLSTTLVHFQPSRTGEAAAPFGHFNYFCNSAVNHYDLGHHFSIFNPITNHVCTILLMFPSQTLSLLYWFCSMAWRGLIWQQELRPATVTPSNGAKLNIKYHFSVESILLIPKCRTLSYLPRKEELRIFRTVLPF